MEKLVKISIMFIYLVAITILFSFFISEIFAYELKNFSNNKIHVSYPGDWVMIDSLNNESQISVLEPSIGAIFGVTAGKLPENIDLEYYTDSAFEDRKNFFGLLDDPQILEFKKSSLDGYPAYELITLGNKSTINFETVLQLTTDLTGSPKENIKNIFENNNLIENLTMLYRHLGIEELRTYQAKILQIWTVVDGVGYDLRFAFPEHDYNNYLPMIEEIIHSFDIIKH